MSPDITPRHPWVRVPVLGGLMTGTTVQRLPLEEFRAKASCTPWVLIKVNVSLSSADLAGCLVPWHLRISSPPLPSPFVLVWDFFLCQHPVSLHFVCQETVVPWRGGGLRTPPSIPPTPLESACRLVFLGLGFFLPL